MTQAQQLYQTINADDKYRSVRWISNVLFTSCGKKVAALRGLKKLVDSGKDVGAIDFIMPYQGIRVDGVAVVAMPALMRGEMVPYTSDWYTH